MPKADPKQFDIEPNVSNHFAWVRTQLGLQRTLMAAVRTSVSLIGFGFTVAQFFQRLQNDAPAGTGHMGPEMPRNFGLVLIGVGVISLAIFTWQYRVVSNHFRTGQYSVIATDAEATHLSTTLTAYAVMLIGVAAFGSVFVRF